MRKSLFVFVVLAVLGVAIPANAQGVRYGYIPTSPEGWYYMVQGDQVGMLTADNLGMVRQWQQMFHGNRYSESYVDALPDFVKLAEAYGHVGIRATKPADVEPALHEAFVKHKNELVFLDFLTDKTANVFPMIAAGKGLSEMILAEEL